MNNFREKKVRENSCSKHWFYDYLKKNNDVKETWENVFGQTFPDKKSFMSQVLPKEEEEEDFMSQTTEITTDENFVDDLIEEEQEEKEEISVLPLATITYEKIQVKMEEEDEKQSLSTAPSECEHIPSWLTELGQDLNFRRGFTPAEVSQTFPEEH